MNIDESGSLCLGTASMPARITPLSMDECESALIDSQFTHTNHNRTIKGIKKDSDHVTFWKSLEDRNAPKRVTTKNLIPCGKLSTILEGLTGS
jgi:hypothetical protein